MEDVTLKKFITLREDYYAKGYTIWTSKHRGLIVELISPNEVAISSKNLLSCNTTPRDIKASMVESDNTCKKYWNKEGTLSKG